MKISYHLGINKYPAKIWGSNADLKGCVADAMSMQKMCDNLGFKSNLMTDAQVDSKTFTRLLTELSTTFKEGTILLSYSGHGIDSKVPDKLTKKQKTITGLCLTDRIFWDFEFKALLAKFDPKVKFIWISDSCFSEGNYRAVQVPLKKGRKERLIIWDKIKEVWKMLFEREAEIKSMLLQPDDAIKCKVYSLLSSQDTETSLEIYGKGVFTSALTKFAKDTWEKTLSNTEKETQKRTSKRQNPAFEFINITKEETDQLMKNKFLVV